MSVDSVISGASKQKTGYRGRFRNWLPEDSPLASE